METTTSRTETRGLEAVVRAARLAADGPSQSLSGVWSAEECVREAFALGSATSREALTVAASGLAEILVAVDAVRAHYKDRPTLNESLGHIREAVESLRASTQAAAEVK